MNTPILDETTARLYVADALAAYRHVIRGQYDKETKHIVPVTQDGAKVIKALVSKLKQTESRCREMEQLARSWHSQASVLPENKKRSTCSNLFLNSARALGLEVKK